MLVRLDRWSRWPAKPFSQQPWLRLPPVAEAADDVTDDALHTMIIGVYIRRFVDCNNASIESRGDDDSVDAIGRAGGCESDVDAGSFNG